MTINEFLEKTREETPDDSWVKIRPAIICKDGLRLSVQASIGHYCVPRTNKGPYSHVEVGFPSKVPPKSWAEYFDGTFSRKTAKHSVYGYVPVEVVQEWINEHGGIDFEKTMNRGIKDKYEK